MMEDARGYKKKRRRLWFALALLVVLLAVVVMPPMVSISRYKSRITELISESLGRPVRMSAVELRLLPVPGFVITDLTVDEDPAFGSEPLLRANTVAASIRLLSLWRGRLEIGTISVDEASFNIVRGPGDRWNLDPLFRTAAAKVQPLDGASEQSGAGQGKAKRLIPLPYIEATHSRVNFKQGAEKLPFSLVDAELSFWQDQPGDWNLRLRGQPARTDLSLDLADTGVVRLEAKVRRAAELRQMPLHLDVEWREAQLGQLTRLIMGSDPGWRGDLTGELHLDGTAEAAQINTRLRATGVHRAEFAPAAPMDFDATCNLLYHYSGQSVQNLACDSPLGDGRIRLAGELPGGAASPRMSVELDRIPVAAGLDALRTVRSDFGAGLEAKGAISGKIDYAPVAQVPASEDALTRRRTISRSQKTRAAVPGPLTGAFTVEGFELSGAGLNTPIQAAKLTLQPMVADATVGAPHRMDLAEPASLEAKVSIPAGGPSPLVITARLALAGYQIAVHGQASIARARELEHLAGIANVPAMDALAGEPATIDLNGDGPWLPALKSPFADERTVNPLPSIFATSRTQVDSLKPVSDPPPSAPASGFGDSLAGTISLHNANWRADYLANHVEIAEATLHLYDGEMSWDPIDFSYGPVKGTASLMVPAHCGDPQPCVPRFQAHFDELDANIVQAAMLGAREPGTMLTTLLARLRPANASNAAAWPALEGSVTSDSLILGPVALSNAKATLHIVDGEAEITGLEADLLGGHVVGKGAIRASSGEQTKPSYSWQGHFEKLSPAAVGKLLGQTWTGRGFDADGNIDVAGFTGKDLMDSAKGTLHFDWRNGAVKAPNDAQEGATGVPPALVPSALVRFDLWSADAVIAGGTITLKDNQVQQGLRKSTVEGLATLGNPPEVNLTMAKVTQARR